MRSKRALLLLSLVAVVGLVAAACGNDDDNGGASGDATPTPTSGGNGESSEFVEFVQRDLAAVGCYSGSIDGIDGPETVAAIEAFQEAEGLTVDGEVGEQTQSALEAAAAAGTTVCGGGGSPTPTPSSGNACDQVTQAEVESGASGFSAVNNWECDTVDDRPWIGGSGVLASSGEDENFILETGGDVAFVEYTGACENPPVPQSLLMFCES